MTMQAKFRAVERKFFASIILLAVFSVLSLGLLLYQANTVRFDGEVSSDELNSLVQDSPAVVEYLQEQKDFEAHFITIANLVKQDQQNDLGRALVLATLGVVVMSGAVGFFAAKYLLRPVREAYESQERFMQDAAHELRNPLAAINVALASGKPTASLVATLKRQTGRLVSIVEDLLFLERRQAGDVVTRQNLSELLQDVLEDLQPAISHKKLQVKTHIDQDVTMKIDPNDFIQLAKNLLDNAIKYSSVGQIVEVSLTVSGKIKLTVKDHGVGIPRRELPRIGDRFYRAQNVSDQPGTGLGIAIVKKILNAYGGKLEIVSKVGKGTTVTIVL